MEKIDFTQEQGKDFIHSFIERIKQFFQTAFHSEKPMHGKELNDWLLSNAQSDEERETLAEIMEKNETYHAKRREYSTSGKTIDDWYNDEIEQSVKHLYPEATDSDIDKVKEAIAKQIDSETEETIQALDNLDDIIGNNSRKEVSE